MSQLSPMMKQYIEVKNSHKDEIVFFRLGDFYEMFYDDAILVSRELDLTLTKKNCGSSEKAPMCGIPYHSCEAYISRLIKKGYKVVMCEQQENPNGKNLFSRNVTRIITPGTVLDGNILDESKNNFLCVLFFRKISVGVFFCDISTGDLKFTEFKGDKFLDNLKNEMITFSPSEALISGDYNEKIEKSIRKFCVYSLKDAQLEFSKNEGEVNKFVDGKIKNRYDLSDEELFTVSRCLGVLFSYIYETQRKNVDIIKNIEFYTGSEYMKLECGAITNLELFETIRTKQKKGSLFWVLDKTRTSMGKRLLRSWIEKPLKDVSKINLRLDGVNELLDNVIVSDELNELLSKVGDLQRLLSKISFGSANCRDLKSLEFSISVLPGIRKSIENMNSKILRKVYTGIDEMKDIFDLLNSAIVEEPPILTKDGGFIKKGYNKDLDEILDDMGSGESLASRIEKSERERTKIPKLKVGFNKVFGYYIEVSQSYKNMVPPDYIRKQTLAERERYITDELKSIEARIFSAKDRQVKLENELLQNIKEIISKNSERISRTSRAISFLDVIRSFAQVSSENSYVYPQIDDSDILDLKECRHPVVEKLLESNSQFIPNDAFFDSKDCTMVITGPNMAGKSTYMRQIALNVIMAQIGCFVAAQSAHIGVIGSIFTRIGASDDVSSGQSTFMVEMNEVSQITKNADSKSLVLLDEIGRGTSTFDGLSIARAVLEFVSKTIKSKTLFSTHYKEISDDYIDNVRNFTIAVKKNGDDIVFLRKIVEGVADNSYGIEVAKLAGVPDEIILRAKQILSSLEKQEVIINNNTGDNINRGIDPKIESIISKIKKIDMDSITPIDSMNILFDLSKLV